MFQNGAQQVSSGAETSEPRAMCVQRGAANPAERICHPHAGRFHSPTHALLDGHDQSPIHQHRYDATVIPCLANSIQFLIQHTLLFPLLY